METLGSGAAVLDLLFQIGSYRSILFDFGTDISEWTFEFYLKKNKGDRLKTLSLTLGSGLSFPVYESDQIQAIFSTSNTSIEEGQYYYELRRTDIALPLINGFAYFSFDAPQGTIDDTALELTVSQQTISVTISNILAQTDHFRGVYTTLIALQAAVPTGNAGDYADVDAGVGTDIQRYIWDVDDAEWVLGGGAPLVLTNGNGTTANGTAVDLGGPANGNVEINLGTNVWATTGDKVQFGVGDTTFNTNNAMAASLVGYDTAAPSGPGPGIFSVDSLSATTGYAGFYTTSPDSDGEGAGAHMVQLSPTLGDMEFFMANNTCEFDDQRAAGSKKGIEVSDANLGVDYTDKSYIHRLYADNRYHRKTTAFITTFSINALASGSGVMTLTNMTNVEQIFPNGATVHLFKFDGTNYATVRITCRVSTGSASVNDPRLFMQYSTDNGSNWITIGAGTSASGDALSLTSTNNQAFTNWVALPAGAKADVLFRVAQNGGDGAADPAVCNVYVSFRT